VVSARIELASKASETSILSVELRDLLLNCAAKIVLFSILNLFSSVEKMSFFIFSELFGYLNRFHLNQSNF
jgi:hypothetical protein